MQPTSPIAAASHADPYAYYERLLAGPALLFDPGLDLWIASRAAVIEEIMANPQCKVRPVAEPVPKAIAGTSAGAVFARLMRMNDGPQHASARQVIGAALAAVDLQALAVRTAALASDHLPADGCAPTRYAFGLPGCAVAELLGFGADALHQVTDWTRQFVRRLSPLSTPDELASASAAAQALATAFTELGQAGAGGLASDIRQRAADSGWDDDDAITANLAGLLSQTHDATAGLIGNCIVALLRDPGRQQQLRLRPQLIEAFVTERARLDPPVQNTRRFVAQPICIAGVNLEPGAVIVLLLAAAGRDKDRPCENPAFGHGRHACPGQAIALTIATAAMTHLVSLPTVLSADKIGWRYAPSVNGRLPQFFDIN